MPAVCTTTSMPPNFVLHLVEHGRDLLFVGDVGRHHHRTATGCGHLVGNGLGAVAVACVVHGHRHAGLPEPDGHGMADAARGSCDDCDALGHLRLLVVYAVSI